MGVIIINSKEFKQYYKNKNYFVSRDGEIYSQFSRRIIKQSLRGNGTKLYPTVDIYINGKQKHISVHRIVYETWEKKLQTGEQVNHIDDNPLNNNIDNLYAGSQKENIRDCANNGHFCGNVYYLTLFDKRENRMISFCPAGDFISYSGHPNKSGSLNKFFSKNWFKSRYEIIEFRKANNYHELEGVTTIPDECREVDRILSPDEAHCTLKKREEIV